MTTGPGCPGKTQRSHLPAWGSSLPYTIASKAGGEEKEPKLLEDAELPAGLHLFLPIAHQVNSLSPILQMRKLSLREKQLSGHSWGLSDEWRTGRHGDRLQKTHHRLHSLQDEAVFRMEDTHFPSPHTPPNSPVYKAVSPIEAATVDEVDTFLEVLFAREESKKVLRAGGRHRSPRSCPHPPTSGMARDRQRALGPQVSWHVR